MKRAVLAVSLILGLLGAAPPAVPPATASSSVTVTGQVLDYEKGWLFLTTGDGFRVAPDATIVSGPPQVREYARITFDGAGTITKIEVSRAKLPVEGDLEAVHRYAVALSPAAPNPELDHPVLNSRCSRTTPGKMVAITITAQVPPTTGATDTIYMTSDQSGWNAQAYRLDRIDALHYRMTLKLYSGTQLHVLFDRGSTQSIQVGENGLEMQPYLLCIGDEDAQAFRATVYHWGDEQTAGPQPVPQALPTPYNPAPFPGLPSPPPISTPHP
jgi:hypothetical protein